MKINEDNVKAKDQDIKVVSIQGKDSFNEVETTIASIWGNVLGLEEIDIYESFNDLGGDSIIATMILKEVEKRYPKIIDISDVFRYPSVVEFSDYISSKLANKEKETVEEVVLEDKEESSSEDDELMDMLKGLKKGDTSIDDALDLLSKK